MKSTTGAEKARLRLLLKERLSQLSPQARRESDSALFARFLALPQLARAHTVLIYCGMGSEPDTARLIPPLLEGGHAVALPRCLPGGGMEARLIRPDTPLVRHPFGMLEPGEDCPLTEPSAIQLVLAPGLAFDRAGGRLGRGGGFYDRWLADYRGLTAALCRDCALLDAVPREEHDRPVDLVICTHGLYGPGAAD